MKSLRFAVLMAVVGCGASTPDDLTLRLRRVTAELNTFGGVRIDQGVPTILVFGNSSDVESARPLVTDIFAGATVPSLEPRPAQGTATEQTFTTVTQVLKSPDVLSVGFDEGNHYTLLTFETAGHIEPAQKKLISSGVSLDQIIARPALPAKRVDAGQ